jgi:hypothetical protein
MNPASERAARRLILAALALLPLLLIALWRVQGDSAPELAHDPGAARLDPAELLRDGGSRAAPAPSRQHAQRSVVAPGARRLTDLERLPQGGPDSLLLTVLDQHSAQPVAGAALRVSSRGRLEFSAWLLAEPDWPSDLAAVLTAITNDRGQADLRGLPPRPLWIEAEFEQRYGTLRVDPPFAGQRHALVLEPSLGVEVQTLWAEDGRPAAGLWLSLNIKHGKSSLQLLERQRSDPQGLARFPHIERHLASLQGVSQGLVIRPEGIWRDAPEVRFDPWDCDRRLELLCPPAGSVRVRVCDEDGQVPEATGSVTLRWHDRDSGALRTDLRALRGGCADFPQIELGLSLVGTIDHPDWRLLERSEAKLQGPSRAGEIVEAFWPAECSYLPDRALLLDPQGRPLARRLVLIDSEAVQFARDPLDLRAETDDLGLLDRPLPDRIGRFLNLPLSVWDGERWLEGVFPGESSDAEADAAPLEVRLVPLASQIEVQALDGAGRPLAGLGAHAPWFGDPYDPHRNYEPDAFPSSALAGHAPLAVSGPDGRLRLGLGSALQPSDVVFAHPLFLRRRFEPPPPQSGPGPVRVRFEPAGMLRGRLRLGPQELLWLSELALVDEASGERVDRARLDRAGRFEFVSIPPGSYRLEALWSLPGLPLVLVRGLEIEAGRVLSGGDLDGIDMSGSLRRLDLHCLDEQGEPLSDVRVFWRVPGRTEWQQERCDREGIARLTLPQGTVELLAHGPGRRAFFGLAGAGEQRVLLGPSPRLSLLWRENPRLLPHHSLTIELSAGDPGWPRLESELRIAVSDAHADFRPYPGGARLSCRLRVRRSAKSGLPEERFEARLEVPLDPNAAQQSVELEWPAELAQLLR